ncbi:MAG: hypothetical protein ACK4E0_15010 [Chitinophagaceae bacterium]|jgi:hypothetical protein
MKLDLKKPLIAGVCFSLLSVSPATTLIASSGGTRFNNEMPGSKKTGEKSRTRNSRKNHAIKIYPDVVKRVMHVVAKENNSREIDFFVFDLQGTLIQHYKMEAGDHEKLVNLKRGRYVYHVFAGDEETASGQFNIR